ncbi:MAG: putative signal peptide protein, partial [Pseudomonadota bacterium]
MLLALVLPTLAAPRINEVLYDPSGTDSVSTEWIELCNPDGVSVDLAGYELWRAGGSSTKVATITAGTLPPFGRALVGGSTGSPIAALGDMLYNGGSSSYGVLLKAPGGAVLDALFYDSPNSNALLDENGALATSFAVDVSEGHSLGRWPDCADTNAPAVDFADYATPSPGAANPSPTGTSTGTSTDTSTGTSTGTAADCTNAAGVRINEFALETGKEFVELHNAGTSLVSLGGWTLEYGTSTYNHTVSLAAATLAPGGHFVLATLASMNPQQVVDLTDLGNATSNPDAMRLRCDTTVLDTIVYGDAGMANPDGWDDDARTDTTLYAPAPGSGKSASRRSDGYDTNDSAADFVVGTPTRGAANPSLPPRVCERPADSRVVINEFLYNPSGTDGDHEWVELYNAGTVATRLDAWRIETATTTWGEDYVFPDGASLDAGARLLVGGPAVTGATYPAEDLSLGNGTGADGVRIVDCTGVVVDTVLYGDTNTEGLLGDGGST